VTFVKSATEFYIRKWNDADYDWICSLLSLYDSENMKAHIEQIRDFRSDALYMHGTVSG
jgi:hypothetical protein